MNFDLLQDSETQWHTHHQTTFSLHSYSLHSSSGHKDLMSSSPALLLPAYNMYCVPGPPSLENCSFHRLSSVRVLVHGSHGCLLESCGTHLLLLLHSAEGNQHHCLLRNVCMEVIKCLTLYWHHTLISSNQTLNPPPSLLHKRGRACMV